MRPCCSVSRSSVISRAGPELGHPFRSNTAAEGDRRPPVGNSGQVFMGNSHTQLRGQALNLPGGGDRMTLGAPPSGPWGS